MMEEKEARGSGRKVQGAGRRVGIRLMEGKIAEVSMN